MADLPKLIHRYEIVERLGRGGMGELYLGRDPLLDRYVAIKVLRAGFEGDELRERFAREARSAARLAHVNIVTIYDVGEDAGQPYIAMEYVRGETLFQIIQRRTDLPLATKLQYIDELCAGLAHAHKAGIVHRDIKPANLIVSAEGSLKILDFGIARLADSSMTQAGMVMGTLNYMSPEQITGQPIDHRSDIFAVGAVFYELLSYQQAFPGGIDSGVLSRIMEGRFTPLPRVAMSVDSAVARLIEKALSRDPNDRFPDLTAMREELARVRQRMDPRVLRAEVETADAGDKTVTIDTPVGTPRTPRGGTNRAEIQRRRAEEVANHLAAAREAFAAGRFDEAAAACERVLIIDPDNEDAHALTDRARAALEKQQVDQRLLEANAEMERGEFDRARDLLSSALLLDPRSTDVRKLRAAIDAAERRVRINAVLARGREAFTQGDAETARAAAQEALRIDADAEGALALLGEVDRFVEERRRQAELDRRAREVIPEARRRFDKGDLNEAIALLQAFAPPHPEVTAALQELRTEARVIREREQERERQVAAELQQARAALEKDDLIAAAAAVARARGASPSHQDVTAVGRLIDQRRAELAAKKKAEDEARRLAEEETKRKAADEKRLAEEARQRQAEEERQRKQAAAQRQAEEQARRKADEDARRQAEEEERRKAAAARAAAAAAAVVAPPAAPSSIDTVALSAASVAAQQPAPAPSPEIRSGGGVQSMVGAMAAAAVIVIALGTWMWMGRDKTPDTSPQPPGVTQTPSGTPAVTPATPPATSPAAQGATGMLVIDAAPWAEIVEIVGANGRVQPPASHTPLALAIPEGEYTITLRNPSDSAPRVVTVRVTAAAPARAFAAFTPVDVDEYFRRAGS